MGETYNTHIENWKVGATLGSGKKPVPKHVDLHLTPPYTPGPGPGAAAPGQTIFICMLLGALAASARSFKQLFHSLWVEVPL